MGQGLPDKAKGLSDVSVMSDDLFGFEQSVFSKQLQFTLSRQIRNGDAWTMLVGMNGTSSFEANSGALVNVLGNNESARAVSAVKRLIQRNHEEN